MSEGTLQSSTLFPLRKLAWAFAFGCVLWPAVTGSGQIAPASQSADPYSTRPHINGDRSPEPDPMASTQAHRLEKMREEERRKRLEADTAKLVALTGELQAEVAKSSKDELSLDVVRKAAEIEKLAHDVKERMKS